jgi:ribosomal protein S18 acetylase RimI-like enzyme
MKVRIATLDDTKQMVENNLKLALESENIIINKEIVFNGIKNLIRNPYLGFYVIAEENNEIIGQLMITFEWSDWNNITNWWIQSVYVKKEFREKKVFTKLIQYVKKLAEKQNIQLFRLYVHNENAKAIKIYKKMKMKKKPYAFFEIPVEKL